MIVPKKTPKCRSEWALYALVVSTIASFGLSIAAGLVHNSYMSSYIYGGPISSTQGMLISLILDTRSIFQQCMYLSAILYIGMKFFETRTILTIAFDKFDADKIAVKGPDENNIVWIGRRYGSKLEAEAVAVTLENRLKENAE